MLLLGNLKLLHQAQQRQKKLLHWKHHRQRNQGKQLLFLRKCTVAGARGVDGANVPRRAVRGRRLKNGNAIVPHQKMAEGHAMDPDNSPVLAIPEVVPCMAAGAPGVHGVHVPRRVGRGHSLKNVDAIILDPNMAESLAKDQGSNPGYAIPGIAQVHLLLQWTSCFF